MSSETISVSLQAGSAGTRKDVKGFSDTDENAWIERLTNSLSPMLSSRRFRSMPIAGGNSEMPFLPESHRNP